MRSKLLFALVATLFAGSAVLAQPVAASVDRRFVKLDQDGKLGGEEAQAGRQEHRNAHRSRFDEHFKAADKDGDDALTKAEAEAAGMGRIVRHFDRIDGNKDGKVTRDELRATIPSRLMV